MIHAVVDVLVSDATVQSTVGKDTKNIGYKVYEVLAPQGTKPPFVTVHLINSLSDDDKDGVSDLDVNRVQVSCFENSQLLAYTLQQVCRTALERYTGTNQSIVIQSIQHLSTNFLYEEDAKVFHYATDYKVRQEI